MSKRKKKKKAAATDVAVVTRIHREEAMGTTAFGTLPVYLAGGAAAKKPNNIFFCKHGEWVELGPYKVWMQGFFSNPPVELDVFIDLECGFSGLERYVPPAFTKYVVESKPARMKWEIRDGGVDPCLAETVVKMLKAGYKVGWGCQQGHGRTGWLAAKVLMMLTGRTGTDALNYIRDKYCREAVETRKQLADLGAAVEADAKERVEHSDYLRWWEGKHRRIEE